MEFSGADPDVRQGTGTPRRGGVQAVGASGVRSRPKLITQIRYKCLFQEEQAAKLRVGSCLQFQRHLEQVQGSLLERGGLR